MQPIEDETIRKAAGGDVAAFREIYDSAFGYVSNTVFRIIGHRQEAEEAVQEVFLTLFHKLKNFRFESSLKTWIYRISVNTAMNHIKKLAREREKRNEIEKEMPTITEANTDATLREEENQALIENLLNILTPGQRACIVLRSIEGLRYEEIAEALKIPVNTVRSRIKRARETMLAARDRIMRNEL